MHALIVVSHPISSSLTHSIAANIGNGISQSEAKNTFEIADIAAEGFDPRFTATDIAVHLRQIPIPDAIVAEQKRIDSADALILTYPIYWWSMPGLLKGWIDRVFTNGWAYDETSNGTSLKRLKHLRVHLVSIGGADMRTYARHGYFGAMRTQIDHGIFNYCGAQVVTTELMTGLDANATNTHLQTAQHIGQTIFSNCNRLEPINAA